MILLKHDRVSDLLTAAMGMTYFGACTTNPLISFIKKKNPSKLVLLNSQISTTHTGPLTLHLAGAEDHTELASF